ncbi:hypothetical protein ACFVTM_09005 [Arthrobacter sp. NPDC058130]|uniref:hypothetical protein n=1 Tax=Arthrobacter sp. NPDC058130 TaxID=3346353 RepID=UPI0036EC37F8
MMDDGDFDSTVEQIAKAAEAIRDVPGGVDPDVLIDELYLGAVAASLESKYVADAAQWANDYQVRILLYRAMGRSLQDTPMLTFRRMLRRRWLTRFLYGAHPDQPDPRNANILLIGPLEELATNSATNGSTSPDPQLISDRRTTWSCSGRGFKGTKRRC